MENKIENEILETPSKKGQDHGGIPRQPPTSSGIETPTAIRIVDEADVYDEDGADGVSPYIEPPKPTRKQKENAQKRKVSQKRLDALKRARESKALKRTENKIKKDMEAKELKSKSEEERINKLVEERLKQMKKDTTVSTPEPVIKKEVVRQNSPAQAPAPAPAPARPQVQSPPAQAPAPKVNVFQVPFKSLTPDQKAEYYRRIIFRN